MDKKPLRYFEPSGKGVSEKWSLPGSTNLTEYRTDTKTEDVSACETGEQRILSSYPKG